MDVKGKRVVVTGASRGIGEALARRFAGHGARVVLVARSAEQLQSLAHDLSGVAVAADLTDAAALRGLIGRIEDSNGPIDVLVNNAGIDMSGAFTSTTAAELDTVVRLNLLAPMELCRQLVPRMLERGRGHIVNVS